MYRVLVRLTCSLVLLTTVGCSSFVPTFFKVNVRQGNHIDSTMVDRLKPGMSKRQVQFIMGTPMIIDPFHENRWDYTYNLQLQGKEVEKRHLSLFFTGDSLSRIEGKDTLPP